MFKQGPASSISKNFFSHQKTSQKPLFALASKAKGKPYGRNQY